MNIRPMTLADLESVLAIEESCFPDPWKDYQFKNELTAKAAFLFVMLELGKVIAYGDIWLTFDSADITNIAVHPNWQGKGYGKKMLCYLLKFAQKEAVADVHLEVNVNNSAAFQLYKKTGFEIVRTRKAYYSDGSDAYDMVLRLGEYDAEDFGNRK